VSAQVPEESGHPDFSRTVIERVEEKRKNGTEGHDQRNLREESEGKLSLTAAVDECNGDLSPASLNFYPAPVGVLLIPELHALIATEVNAQSPVIFFGELEPERLDSLPV
jgi:hypothetical protein